MLIKEILEYCDKDYLHKSCECPDCNHPNMCPGNCGDCLKQIHFKSNIPQARHSYDCVNLVNYYVCKYALKYTSEIYNALYGLGKIASAEKLKVLSIGCGPCTDLFALDIMRKRGHYSFEKVEYLGVEPLASWSRIHNKIAQYDEDFSVHFEYSDIQRVLPILKNEGFEADVIIMNYLLSDFHKYGGQENVLDFLDELVYYIEKVCPNTVIIINDINLECSRGGGRDYFDTLFWKLQPMGFQCSRRHFNNSNRENHYHYGIEYSSNNLVFPDKVIGKYINYSPFETCASAQIIIYKE